MTMLADLPDKTYFKIGEVAQLADIKTSVLRYWETEFPFLNPEKSSAGQRLYTRQDIEMVRQIKQLLYQEKYTIEGVRQRFAPRRSTPKQPVQEKLFCNEPSEATALLLLQQVRQELLLIRGTLENSSR